MTVVLNLTDEEATVMRQLMDYVGGCPRNTYRAVTDTVAAKLCDAGSKWYSNDAVAFDGAIYATERLPFVRDVPQPNPHAAAGRANTGSN